MTNRERMRKMALFDLIMSMDKHLKGNTNNCVMNCFLSKDGISARCDCFDSCEKCVEWYLNEVKKP